MRLAAPLGELERSPRTHCRNRGKGPTLRGRDERGERKREGDGKEGKGGEGERGRVLEGD